MDINYFHIQFIIILISLTIGYVVWTYNSKSYLNRILTLIIICVILIEISLLLQLKADRDRFLYTIIILGSIGISFFTPLFYMLSLYYPIKKKFKTKQLVLIYCIAMVFSVLIIVSFPTRFIIEKLAFPTGIKDISLADLPLLFLLLYFFLTSFSLVLLFFATKNFLSSFAGEIIPYEKNTIRLLIAVGAPLAYLLSIVDVINYFFNIPFPWIGFFLGFFTLFIVVLIFRFHLVDLKRLLNNVLFFPALIAILVFVYISVLLKHQDAVARTLNLPVNVTLILEVFIIYLVVSTLKRLLDIPFIKTRFPNVASSMSSNIEPLAHLSYALTIEGLFKRLKQVFRVYSKIERFFFLIRDKERQAFQNVDESNPFSLPVSGELANVLFKIDRGVTLEELLIFINNREDIKRLHEIGVNLILPITRGEEIMALILLPRRSIIQRWSYDDICSLNYLKVIMPALIDRCIMYENEKEIEKHEYRMEQLMVMGQMASGLAHEIKNPLSIISTSVETILKNEIADGDRLKMLRYIQEETDRINILAEKLLSISFQKKPDFQNVDLLSVFSKLKDFLSYKLSDKNIKFIIKNHRSYKIYSDPNILFQIFLNLSLNSIEAITNGGMISIDYQCSDDSVTIFHEDDGPGVPLQIQDKIFEPFFTMKKEGSGLGLTVSRKLAEQLFGSLEHIPTKKGACFKSTFLMMNEER
jgi:signal transduction histidine kinase